MIFKNLPQPKIPWFYEAVILRDTIHLFQKEEENNFYRAPTYLLMY